MVNTPKIQITQKPLVYSVFLSYYDLGVTRLELAASTSLTGSQQEIYSDTSEISLDTYKLPLGTSI